MKLFVLEIIGISLFVLLDITNAESCESPTGQLGSCVELSSCASLKALLTKDFVSEDDLDLLLKSQCGYTGLVCCVDANDQRYQVQPSVRTKTTRRPSSRTTRPHSVTLRSKLPIPGQGECGIHSTDKIYGGRQIAIDEHPWMALLEYNDKGKNVFGCGGALINNRYVLTAAHCIRSVPKLKSVRLGEWNTKTQNDCNSFGECADPVQDIPIEQITVHKDYRVSDGNSHHDIALLRLSRPVRYSYFIKPICLPTSSESKYLDKGSKFTVAGWGRTENGVWSDVKLKVDVNGVDRQACSQVYQTKGRQIIPQQICAGGQRGQDSCGGDSGGPLMRESQDNKGNQFVSLEGLVSYGPTLCGMKGWPGVYTRVASYVTWIQDNIRS